MFLFYTTRKHQKSSGNVLKFMQTVLYKNNVSSYLVGFPALGEPIILLEAVVFFVHSFSAWFSFINPSTTNVPHPI